ncbi:zonular occludens toxin domain-containing protein [Pseudomonas sp. CCC2.2]|uniref:zonular occludens toxin domain-containing protein n=1 Tax=Pseudomonas sp. CCC2.2 TaxID=3048605 RepID=UPI002B239020|nr:zonular occludens toxin domain-containing protein [Pseudomonas sp. CCC2.2]MEB0147540.1 zonular occludens toxin domain-containing protein [Pseudomonas sp. CCC2.2]
MAVYFVTGKLGSGKSLVSVSKIRDYLSDGRRVATNLDLELDSMFTYSKASATRLPDKPRVEDMRALGDGYESDDPKDNNESRYGLIVLDECGTWLNSREWNDKGRRELINWFLHARKHRWDIIFLIQDIESADSQIVRALCEHLVICRRLDRMRFMRVPLPRVHIANVYYGRNKENFVERWMYKGKDLYSAYDTRQVFRDGIEFFDSGAVDMRASYTMLSAWHLKGRYLPEQPSQLSIRRRLFVFWGGLIVKPVLGICQLFITPDEFERTFFHRRRMARISKTIEKERSVRETYIAKLNSRLV